MVPAQRLLGSHQSRAESGEAIVHHFDSIAQNDRRETNKQADEQNDGVDDGRRELADLVDACRDKVSVHSASPGDETNWRQWRPCSALEHSHAQSHCSSWLTFTLQLRRHRSCQPTPPRRPMQGVVND